MYFANFKRIKIKTLNIIIMLSLSFQTYALHKDTRPYELKYADKKLNQYYKVLLNKLNKKDKNELIKAQRQWITFRDLDCKWPFKIEPIDCMITHTENRLSQFQNTLFFNKKGQYSSIESDREEHLTFKTY